MMSVTMPPRVWKLPTHVGGTVVVPVPETVGQAKHGVTRIVLSRPDARVSCHPGCASWCRLGSAAPRSACLPEPRMTLVCQPCGRSWDCQTRGTGQGFHLILASAEGTGPYRCPCAPGLRTCTLSHRTSTLGRLTHGDALCRCIHVHDSMRSHLRLLLC